MKKALLFVFAFSIALIGFAQERAVPVSKDLVQKSVTRVFDVPSDPVPPMVNTNYTSPGVMKDAKMLGDETEIIETKYDLQTNTSVGNRMVVWDDGSMAAICTRGVESPAGFAFPDRGTGYNYYNGSTWGPKPSSRIETVRTGWPSIAKWGANGEIVIAHQSGANPLVISRRETKGTGAWTEELMYGPNGTAIPQYLWPRMITSGENNEYMHVFGLTAPSANGGTPWLGQDGALLYNRSSDGGATWDYEHVQIEGTGSDYYLDISADDYVLASRGNTVALLMTSAWIDLFILKSTDNGETWDKIMIWEHPYPFFDIQSTLMDDTLYSVDNSGNLAIDENGMVHVVWGIGRVARLNAAPPDPGYYSYWPYTDGIGYWNESMGQIPDAENVHHTMMPEYLETLGMLIGWTQDVNNSGFIFDYEGTGDPQFATYRSLGISTMPSIAINGNMIALVYSSTTETFVTTDGTLNYKHIWARFSYDLGETWGDFHDLNGDNIFHQYDESIYPILAANTAANGAFQMIYQADNAPDLYLDEELQLEPTINRIIHNSMGFTVGIDNPTPQVSGINVSQSYPNPATGNTMVTVELEQTATVGFEVFNMTGQKVFEIPVRTMTAGINNITFNVSSLTSGVYFYTVDVNGEKITHKMIVK